MKRLYKWKLLVGPQGPAKDMAEGAFNYLILA